LVEVESDQEETLRSIKKQLKSNNSSYRMNALFMLRKFEFPERGAILKEIIKRDSEINVRELALLILNEQKNPDTVIISRRLFYNTTDNHIIRGRAIWALGRNKGPEIFEIIKAALDDRSEEVVYWAINSLLNYQEDEFVTNKLGIMLTKHRSKLVRLAIILYFGFQKDEKYIPIIVDRLFNDSDYMVRLQAAWALRNLASIDTTESLCNALQKERNDMVRREIAYTLGIILEKQKKENRNTISYSTKIENVIQVLTKTFSRDTEYVVRRACVESFGRIKDKRALPILISKLALDTNNFVRKEIIQTLGKIGDPQALDILNEAKKSQYSSIVKAATEAIKQIQGYI
jgi:HEAT repeat protein